MAGTGVAHQEIQCRFGSLMEPPERKRTPKDVEIYRHQRLDCFIYRLVLDKEDPWWDRFSHKEGILKYNKLMGMAPLRKIWRRTGIINCTTFWIAPR